MDPQDEAPNTSPPVRTGADGFASWLTVKEAVAYCRELGLSRTQKTVRRWAQLARKADDQGEVKVRHQDTENGFRWLIERSSLDVKIAQEKELEARKAEAPPEDQEVERVGTGADLSLHVRTGAEGELPDSSPPEHVRTGAHPSLPVRTDESSNEMIGFLKNQIEEKDRQLRVKDDQIAGMLERDRETNFLIGKLQEILSLQAPRGRQAGREGDNSPEHHE